MPTKDLSHMYGVDGSDFGTEELKWREPHPDPTPKLGDGTSRTALPSADDETWDSRSMS